MRGRQRRLACGEVEELSLLDVIFFGAPTSSPPGTAPKSEMLHVATSTTANPAARASTKIAKHNIQNPTAKNKRPEGDVQQLL